VSWPVKVLVVDDSAFSRRLLTDILEADPQLQVVGYARNGREALEKIAALRPQVVTLDLEMPVMDGLATLEALMASQPVAVIMLSAHTAAGAEVTIKALELGAVDFVLKPLRPGETKELGRILPEKIKAAARAPVARLCQGKPCREILPAPFISDPRGHAGTHTPSTAAIDQAAATADTRAPRGTATGRTTAAAGDTRAPSAAAIDQAAATADTRAPRGTATGRAAAAADVSPGDAHPGPASRRQAAAQAATAAAEAAGDHAGLQSAASRAGLKSRTGIAASPGTPAPDSLPPAAVPVLPRLPATTPSIPGSLSPADILASSKLPVTTPAIPDYLPPTTDSPSGAHSAGRQRRNDALSGAVGHDQEPLSSVFAWLPASDHPSSPAIIAIGASTGGPAALRRILTALPGDLPAGIVVVQHMPPGFTGPLARRLNELSALEVREAAAGDIVRPGVALIAPAGQQMSLEQQGDRVRVLLTGTAPISTLFKPSVDVLMLSVARVYGSRSLGVILTGMGNDGVRGLRAIKDYGGRVLAQDESSSIVYGMPRAAAEAGVVDRTVPLEHMAEAIMAAAGYVPAGGWNSTGCSQA